MSSSDHEAVNNFWAETINGLEHSERYHLSRTNCWKFIHAVTSLVQATAVLAVVLFASWLDLDDDLIESAIEIPSALFALFGSQMSRRKARKRMELHDSIRRDYLREKVKLEQGRLTVGEEKAALASAALAEKNRIEQKEVDHLRVLQANCSNEILVAQGHNKESDGYIKISFLQRRFMHLFDLCPHRLFSNRAKREARAIAEKQKRACS